MKKMRVLFTLILIFTTLYIVVKANSGNFHDEYLTTMQANIFAIGLIFLILFPDFFSFVFFTVGLVLFFINDIIILRVFSFSIALIGIMSFLFAHRFFYLSKGYHYYCPKCDQFLGSHVCQCPLCGNHKVKKIINNHYFYLIYSIKKRINHVFQ